MELELTLPFARFLHFFTRVEGAGYFRIALALFRNPVPGTFSSSWFYYLSPAAAMGRYRSAAFTGTSLTSYLLKLILQRRCTYVSAKCFKLYVLLRRKPLSLSVLFLYVCCCFCPMTQSSSRRQLFSTIWAP